MSLVTEPDTESTLLDLLAAWEDTRATGQSVAAEEICAARPDLLEEFRRRAKRIAALDPLLALAGLGSETHKPEIPGFDLDELIGVGGMGVVWRGRDQMLKRVVAVKLPVGLYDTAAVVRRFRHEGQALARLRHPNIVSIHSAAVAELTPYLVMDYVPGGNLGRWVTHPEPPDRVAGVLEQVCRAVDHAHRSGIVHRDLKPTNILIDEHGHPWVSDFGVATLLADEPVAVTGADLPSSERVADSAISTVTAGIRGTPAYTAPEQLESERGTFVPSADIWSIGVILYELLTGQRPLPPDAPADARPAPARSIRPTVPAGLERIALRCLERCPADRYPSAAAVADALRAWRTARRRRALRIGACIAALAAVVLAFGFVWFSPEARFDRQVRAAQARLKADGSLDLLTAGRGGRALAVKRYGAEATDLRQDGEGFGIDTTREASYVELLPSVPAERYTVRATIAPGWLRNGRLDFGVVYKSSAFNTDQGPQNYVHGLFVSNGSKDNSAAILEQRWYGSGPGEATFGRNLRPVRGSKQLATVRRTFNGRLLPGGEEWEFTIRVTPADMTGTCSRSGGAVENLGPITAADRVNFLNTALKLYPDARPFENEAVSGAGVGVFVGYGSCTVRRFMIELD